MTELHREYAGGDGRTWSDESGSWAPVSVTVSLDFYGLLLRYRAACEAAEQAMADKARLRHQLLEEIGPYTYAEYMGRRVVTVSRTRPKRFNTSAFRADHPALYEQYLVEPDEDVVTLRPSKEIEGDG